MNGLTNEQVVENREKYGSNKLPEPKLKKWYHFAKDALCEKITMILIAIAMLQMVLGFLGVMELSEPLMIMFVLAIVTCIAVKTGDKRFLQMDILWKVKFQLTMLQLMEKQKSVRKHRLMDMFIRKQHRQMRIQIRIVCLQEQP